MAYKNIKKVLTADELIAQIPLSSVAGGSVIQHRREIMDILSGVDGRLLVIVGPCSAWPFVAVLQYAEKLLQLSQRVQDKLKLVMRLYVQPPSEVNGLTSIINKLSPLTGSDAESRMKAARRLMVQIVEMGLAIADEAIYTHNAHGFSELLSWTAISSRSSEDQEHRIHASALDCPVGLKNPLFGALKIGVNSVVAAQHAHTAIFDGTVIKTDGNPFAHLVLRGSNGVPNYGVEYLREFCKHAESMQVQNPVVIIDAAHDNCVVNGVRDYTAQGNVVFDVLNNVAQNPELQHVVKGFMLESFIKDGRQELTIDSPVDLGGLSITDPCIGWEATEALLLKLASETSSRT